LDPNALAAGVGSHRRAAEALAKPVAVIGAAGIGGAIGVEGGVSFLVPSAIRSGVSSLWRPLSSCTYCSAGYAVGKQYRTRPICEITAELERLPGRYDYAVFLDDNLGWDVKYAKELFRALIPLNIRWSGQLSLSALEDSEFAQFGC
jgi:hypothetical protein